MADIKLTFFFRALAQPLGWSEVHYLTGTDFTAALDSGEKIGKVRILLMPKQFRLEAVRASGNEQPGTPGAPRQRKAAVKFLNLDGSRSGDNTPDTVWQSVIVRLSNTDGTVFRTQLLRGLSDEFWSNGDDQGAITALAAWLPKYQAVLVGANAAIRHLVRGNPVRSFVSIQKAQFERLTRRATGRPSYQPRGRRPKKPA